MGVSEENRRIATYLRDALGGPCKVQRYFDENEKASVQILSATETPGPSLTTYATVSLSDHPTGLEANGLPLRVEVMFAARSDAAHAPNIVATCAFNAMNSGWPVTLNAMHRGLFRMYYPEHEMAHAILVSPFSFKLETQRMPARTVAWLQVLAVSDAELAFAETQGVDALCKQLEAVAAPAFDIKRRSIF